MTETTTETQATTQTQTTPAPDPIEALRSEFAEFRAAQQAEIASITKRYNAELAGNRRKLAELLKDPEAPATKAPVESGQPTDIESTMDAMMKIAQISTRLTDAQRTQIDEKVRGRPAAEKLAFYELAELFSAAPAAQAKPGRDALPTPGQRAHAPAARTAEGYPTSHGEWMDVVRKDIDKARKFLAAGFDPESLKR